MGLDGLNAPVRVSDTEVLLEVESVLGYPERISHVGSDYLESLHALVAGERVRLGADVPGLADVLGTIHKEVLDDHEQHLDVVPG